LRPRGQHRDRFCFDEYGSYYHQYLTVSLKRIDSFDQIAAIADSDRVRRIKSASSDLDAAADAAMNDVTILHEFRHFHDAFGTLAGFSLFLDYMQIVAGFHRVCGYLANKKMRWKLPVSAWVQAPDCPNEVKEIFTAYRHGRFLRQVFLGSFELPIETGSSDEVAAKFVFTPSKVFPDLWFPAYPSNLSAVHQASGITEAKVAWRPIGFEALLEGNAQALQRTMIEQFWGRDVADRVWAKMTTHVAPDGSLQADDLGPYLTTDFFFTRFLQRGFGVETFHRDLILDITDAALMDSALLTQRVMTDRGPAFEKIFRQPGRSLVERTSRIKWTGEARPSSGAPASSSIDGVDAVKRMENLIAQIPPWDALARRARSVPPTEALLSFAAHKIVHPLLQIRREQGDGPFRTLEGYLRYFTQFPTPPLIQLRGSLHRSNEFTPDLHQKLAEFIFLEKIMHTMLGMPRDAPSVIFCPRAMGNFPASEHYEFEPIAGCQSHIEQMTCLCWMPGRLPELPDCYLPKLIQSLSIDEWA